MCFVYQARVAFEKSARYWAEGTMAKRKARQPAAPAKAPQQEAPSTSEPQFKNKERVLIVSSRGITFRYEAAGARRAFRETKFGQFAFASWS